MIKQADEFNKFVAIAGFKDVHIRDVDTFLATIRKKLSDVDVQFFDANLTAGWQHLYFAALNALKAFKNKTNISKNLAIECLLYASAKRQISAALDLIGIGSDTPQVAVLVIADKKSVARKSVAETSALILGRRDDDVLALSDEKVAGVRRLFTISDTELAAKREEDGEKKALSDLVIEHVALLTAQQ